MKNCFTYAFFKFLKEDGYFIIRRSKLSNEYNITSLYHPIRWLPHFMHRSVDGVITQYALKPSQIRKEKRSLYKRTMKYIFGSLLGALFFVLFSIATIAILLLTLTWSFNGKVLEDDNF